MTWSQQIRQPGVLAALGAALLFGAGTPIAKLLLNGVSPWVLAGLLYVGSGIGLTVYRLAKRAPAVHVSPQERLWFVGAILAGGIVGPALLMIGLNGMPASGASLLLNVEAVFTALLAWFVFRENFDRRIALGMATIVAGAIILSWPGEARFAGTWPALAIVGACFAWGIDNNLTRKISLTDSTWIAGTKGLVAGAVNLTVALALGASLPALPMLAGALVLGFFAYGASLALFVIGLRHLGTARTAAYFSIAPFFGSLLAVAMGEPVSLQLALAGGLMALGIWLHLTERHEHKHVHAEVTHDHEHVHDEHHQHEHEYPVLPGTAHRHSHRHRQMVHSHPHYPDAHHGHTH
jgi:drug/metabolite transporter (DMT)-like permease